MVSQPIRRYKVMINRASNICQLLVISAHTFVCKLVRPVTATEEGTRRRFQSAELSRAGCVFALGDERVQIGDTQGLLSLVLFNNDNNKNSKTDKLQKIP